MTQRGPAEQDEAAGGRQYRELRLPDGTVVTASVSVRRYIKYRKSHQDYGYLQFKADGKTVTKYVGKVTAETHAASVKMGWELLRQRRIAESCGWKWVVKPPR